MPIHLLRTDPRIELADIGSKWQDSDDWSVDVITFKEIERFHGIKYAVDLFADSNNTKVPKVFFSRFMCPGSQGVDAFAHSWEGIRAWVCPPTSRLIERAMMMILSFLYIVFCKRAKRLSFFEQIPPRAGGGNFFSYMGLRERARKFFC